MAKSIMIQGTASGVGKSIITAGLCRIFHNKGFRTAPFKSQNMALNSFVTRDGHEMGRAQAMQAQAAGIEPDVRMNPVLLKPISNESSQVIVMGKALDISDFHNFIEKKEYLRKIIADAFQSLAGEYDIIVIEGAGSPAEINLKNHELTNMSIAKLTCSPVILAGDIDRGGVFASLVGTLELLDPDERERIKGFIINKFRGDQSLLKPALDYLKDRTGKPLLGVIPTIPELNLPEEDSVNIAFRNGVSGILPKDIIIGVIDIPHISNTTDYDPFLADPGVHIFITRKPEDLDNADLIILPGSKNVPYDISILKKEGFDKKLLELNRHGKMIAGICGGYQMLGKTIMDPEKVESAEKLIEGFGLLNMETVFEKEKHLTQTTAVCLWENINVCGYEIHHGRSVTLEKSLFADNPGLGSINRKGNVWGSYLHGIFDNDLFRHFLLNKIRKIKGLPPRTKIFSYNAYSGFDKLEAVMRENLDLKTIEDILWNT